MKARFYLTWAFIFTAGLSLAACSDKTKPAETTATVTPSSVPAKTETATMSEFVKTDVKVGDGAEATLGKIVSVHYTGWLYDPNAADKHGTKFDSSRDRGQAFEFPLGGGRVIQGWDQGVAGMKVGGQRTLIIPAELGYGTRGAGGVIPPNATLIFDVELLGVQ
jgi:FKBP-type peptidyl-prolyl cis-trans isomerase